jgi:hypothetical protein
MLTGGGHLLVSCYWSDSPQKRFLVSHFYDDDMCAFLFKDCSNILKSLVEKSNTILLILLILPLS